MENNIEKTAALSVLAKINQVDGFDPSALAVEYTDMNNGEKRKRLPVMAQMGWFRLRHPMGRIAVTSRPGKDYCEAHARVYANCNDPVDSFLGEGTAARGYDPKKPNISPREWAQTAAIGIALRNAGFGLSFDAAGDSFDHLAVVETGTQDLPFTFGSQGSAQAVPEGGSSHVSEVAPPAEQQPVATEVPAASPPIAAPPVVSAPPPAAPAPALAAAVQPAELDYDSALQMPCPIKKHANKTLGEVLVAEPECINWLATRYEGDEKITEAARVICEHALYEAS